MEMRKGCAVPFPDALTEGYEIHENGFIANVSADKIRDVMEHFVAVHNEPMFFILEIPSRYDDESDNGDGTVSSFHKDVYYIDGCSREDALAILECSSSVLINDGLCSFGFGCHDSRDEIIFGKYNVTTVFTENKQRFSGFFEKHDIRHTCKLLTAPETFSAENPGISRREDTGGKSVYSVIDDCADRGIYKAERREE